MDSYEELVGVKTRFENCSEADLFTYLYSFQTKWILENNKNVSLYITKAIENYGLDAENYTYEELDTNYKKCLYTFTNSKNWS